MKQASPPRPPPVSRETGGGAGRANDPDVAIGLARFRDTLLRWNGRINLIGEKTAHEIERRHIADSLQLLPLMQDRRPVADLGSGAGFPGLVLAIADPGRIVHLVESDRRKAAFLADVVGQLGLRHVRIHPIRIERFEPPPDLAAITARALAPLSVLLGHAHRLLPPGGVAIFPKGRTAEQELTDAQRHWHMTVERFPSQTDPGATILRISEIHRAAD